MADVFYWVFNMSVSATLVGAVVMLIRLIKPIPRRFVRILWAAPYLRFLLPFGVNSPFSLMALLDSARIKTVVVYQSGDIGLTMKNTISAADSYFPIVYKTDLLKKIFEVSSAIWLTVALAGAIALTLIYIVTMRELRGAENADGIYYSDKVTSPALYGVLRPRIILPTYLKGRDNSFILMHERAHIRRGDNFFRVAAIAVTVVHWFNPFAWIFLKLFLADTELACDESVLKKCGEDRAKEYAHALVDFEEEKNLFASAFGGAKVRLRVKNILSYKNLTWASAVGFSALAASIIAVLVTNSP